MIKDVFLMNSADLPNELPAFERYYYRYHAPEVMSNRGPLLVRFVGYRPLPVIPEALDYAYYNQRVTESWFRSVEERPPISVSVVKYTGQAPWAAGRQRQPPSIRTRGVSLTVPTQPTEVFMGGKFTADEKSFIRWVIVTKYPDGVPVEEGENWFLNVHSKEVLEQPGLLAYFSHRSIKMKAAFSPIPWVRLTEQWYEDFNGWKKAVIDSPPKYTEPSWANHHKYPFLEPYVDFASTFLMEHPDHDFLRECAPYP